MISFFKVCCAPSNILRSVLIAAIVGSLLILLNHYETVTSGNLTGAVIVRLSFNYLVPFVVSLIASTLQIMKYEE